MKKWITEYPFNGLFLCNKHTIAWYPWTDVASVERFKIEVVYQRESSSLTLIILSSSFMDCASLVRHTVSANRPHLTISQQKLMEFPVSD